MRAKSSLIALICSICLLALLALFFAISGAWYRAQRNGTAEMFFNAGIKFEFTNTDIDGNLKYFYDGDETNTDSSNILPLSDLEIQQNTTYKILKPSISVVSGTKAFYARAKIVYNFYKLENNAFVQKTPSQLSTSLESEISEEDIIDAIISENLTFNSKWLLADDGYYYYSANPASDVSQDNLQLIDQNSSEIEIISGNSLSISNWEELDSFPYTIDKLEIKLEFDVIEENLKSTWNPESAGYLDLALYELRDENGVKLSENTTLNAGTTYQVVKKSDNTGYKFTFVQNNGVNEMTITGPVGSPTSLDIAASVKWNENKYITRNISNGLTNGSFRNCTSLISITIPKTVNKFNGYAFEGCSNLESLTILGEIESIGFDAFTDCSSLQNAVGDLIYIKTTTNNYFALLKAEDTTISSATINENCKFILHYAFQNYTNLSSITIPNSVTSIGYAAFSGCTSLTSIIIPNSVTTIGGSVFSGCTSLESVVVGTGVTSLESLLFSNCSNLENLTILGEIESVENGVFSGCSSLQNTVGDLIYIKTTTNNYFALLKAEDTTISSATINENCKFILHYAFQNCTSLESITISSSVTSIGSSAFNGCTNLSSITIPDSVTSIGNYAFSGCSSLTSITIPSGVTSIVSFTFQNCTSLENITIPSSVTTIGSDAFNGCTSLASITIPSSVTTIGGAAFSGCTSLDFFTVSSENSVYSTLDNGNLLLNYNTLVAFAPYGLTSYVIPTDVESIELQVFSGYSNLTSITIPKTVTSVGFSAFKTAVSAINVPSTTTFYFSGNADEWLLGTSGDIFGRVGYNENQTITIYTLDNVNITYTMNQDTCLVEGTKVALADGSVKNVEDITYNDLLLAKDLIDGGFSAQYATWVEKVATTGEYTLITFDDGNTLKIVGPHALFDVEKNCFVEFGSTAFPLVVGTKAYKLRTDENGNLIKDENGNFISFASEVISIETVYEEVNFYHIFSSIQHNVISDGVMTVAAISPLMNMYGFDEEMRFIKENREKAMENENNLYTFEDYKGYIPYWLYVGFRADECKYLSVSGMMSEDDWFDFVIRNAFEKKNYVEPDRQLIYDDVQETLKIIWTVSTSNEFENLFDESYEKTKVFDGDEFTLPEPKEVSGKTFVGWKSSIDGKLYQVGDKVQIWLGTHFEAIWQ